MGLYQVNLANSERALYEKLGILSNTGHLVLQGKQNDLPKAKAKKWKNQPVKQAPPVNLI